MKNVRKNSKLWKQVTQNPKTVKFYDLANCFRGEFGADIEHYKKVVQRDLDFGLRCRVTNNEDGTFTVRWNSNSWEVVTL